MFIVIGKLTIKESKINEAIALSQKHVSRVRQQAGCISYAAHTDTELKNLLVFIERWQTMDHLEKHFQTNAALEFAENISKLVKETPSIEIYHSKALQRH
jgi:quinol monooxygenase YgiN